MKLYFLRFAVLLMVLPFLFASCDQNEEIIDKYLQLWYKMDETNGTVVNDSSGNGYHANVVGGAAFNADGSGINLNNSAGQTKYISLPRNILENVPGDFTITTKVFFRSGGTWSRIFDFGPGSTSNIMFLTADTQLFKMDNAANDLIAPAINNNANNTNVWRAISITRKGNTTTMYINGEKVESITQSSNANRTPPAGQGQFYIGRANWDDPYPDMMLSDFRIYSRALTADELANMYRNFQVDALKIKEYYTDGDALPSTLLGLSARWSAKDGVSVKNGRVVADSQPKIVTVTAAFGSYTKSFDIIIIPKNYWTNSADTVNLDKSLGNPVTRHVFIGDPSPVVVGDTVWLIGGLDQGGADYHIPEYVAYYSKDLINWTYHGTVMKMTDVSWMTNNSAWAAQMIPYNGKYYLYTCGWGIGTYSGTTHIGVAVADSPGGPYVDIGRPLVRSNTTTDHTSDFNDIDPTVWVETIGGVESRYLAWGNGKFYICELNEDMISVKDRNGDGQITLGTAADSDIREMTAGNLSGITGGSTFTEAPWFYKRNGIYYTFFAGGWREDLSYARAQNIFGPWRFSSQLIAPSSTSNTHHMGVIDFNGKTYMFYHNGALPGGSGYRRSANIVELKFDERGFVYPMHELSIGLSGKASTLRTSADDYIGYTWFTNTRSDGFYPITRDINIGTAGVSGVSGLQTAWEITQGRGRSGDAFVSIQAAHKPGLFITAETLSTVRLKQDTNAALQDAQTFRTIAGDSGGVRFESVLYPGKFLTSEDGRLILTDGPNAAASTFKIEDIAVDPYLPMPFASYPDGFMPQ